MTWQCESGSYDDGDWNDEPVEKNAASVAHLRDDQLAANVGEHDSDHEREAARIALQDVGG